MTQDQDQAQAKIETGEATELASLATGKSLDELLREREQLDAHIARLQRAERADDLAKARELVRRHGFTSQELRCPGATAVAEPQESSESARRPVSPKYRNPETGDTWTGRGLKPKWVEAALASGKSLDDLLIPQAETEAA